MPVELMSKIEYATEKLGLSKQDVMREAIKLGLAHYERIGWDVQGAVLDKSAALAPTKIIPASFSQSRENLVAEGTTDSTPLPQAPTNYKHALKHAKRGGNEG